MAETRCISFGLVIKLLIERYSRFRLYRSLYIRQYNVFSDVFPSEHLPVTDARRDS